MKPEEAARILLAQRDQTGGVGQVGPVGEALTMGAEALRRSPARRRTMPSPMIETLERGAMIVEASNATFETEGSPHYAQLEADAARLRALAEALRDGAYPAYCDHAYVGEETCGACPNCRLARLLTEEAPDGDK